MKTVTVNAFIAWRMMEKKDLLATARAFSSIDSYRHELNSVQSLADFVHDVCFELLDFAGKLDGERTTSVAQAAQEEDSTESDCGASKTVGDAEASRLSRMAAKRLRKRFAFFNSEDGRTLRLCVPRHEQQQQGKDLYCALCGGHKEGWRGRKTTFKCSLCNVHLCVRTFAGLRKSCWDIWHTKREVQLRRTPPPNRTNTVRGTHANDSAGVDNDDHSK